MQSFAINIIYFRTTKATKKNTCLARLNGNDNSLPEKDDNDGSDQQTYNNEGGFAP